MSRIQVTRFLNLDARTYDQFQKQCVGKNETFSTAIERLMAAALAAVESGTVQESKKLPLKVG